MTQRDDKDEEGGASSTALAERIEGVGASMRKAEGFDSTELAPIVETAASAVAQQATAQVQARYLMALKRPRNMDNVRVLLLRECKRPGFAHSARYRKPIGKGIEGPSIRFAEAAARLMGNILPETLTTYDDAEKRIVRVSVTDLETNICYSRDVVIEKTVERSQPKDGIFLRVRVNSQGKKTYLVPATEDDLLNKENALISKALRTAILRLLPGDILEEAMEQCIETARDRSAQDPDAERKRLADAFAELRVMPTDLAAYLGHDMGSTSPAELVELRGIYVSLKDGEAKWKDILDAKAAEEKGEKPEGEGQPEAPAANPKGTATSRIADKAKANATNESPATKAAREKAEQAERDARGAEGK